MPFEDGANKNVRDENVSDIFGRIAGNISESYNEGGIDGVLLDGISAYAGFIGSSAVSEFNETVQGWFDAASGFGRIGNAIGNAWSSVVETVGGWFEGGEEQAANPAQNSKDDNSYSAQIRKLKELEKAGKDKNLINKLLEYQLKIAAKEEANRVKAEKGEGYSVFDSTEEAFDYIQTKKLLGEPLDANDARMLAQTMKQMKDGGKFSQEFADFIRTNKDKFGEFKIPGLKLNNDESINAFAIRVTKGACFMNTIFMNIVLSSVTDGVPKSWGDMYIKAMENGLLNNDGVNSSQYMNTRKGVQAWVDGIIGKDVNGNSKLTVEGYFKGDGTKATDIMNKIQLLATRGVLASGGRFSNNNHSMMQFLTNGKWGVYDTGRPSYTTPRPYGTPYDKYYLRNDINSFWILR